MNNNNITIFLDESGDLGFNFNDKKSSTYFVLTALVVSTERTYKDIIKRAVKTTLKNKVNKKRRFLRSELKGSNTTFEVKHYFYKKIEAAKFDIFSVVLSKKEVSDLIDGAPSKERLYNYLAHLLIEKVFQANPYEIGMAHLVVDKCKNAKDREEFDDYLRYQLQSIFPINTKLFITHENSQNSYGLQAVDLFCYGIMRKFALKDVRWFDIYKGKIKEIKKVNPVRSFS